MVDFLFNNFKFYYEAVKYVYITTALLTSKPIAQINDKSQLPCSSKPNSIHTTNHPYMSSLSFRSITILIWNWSISREFFPQRIPARTFDQKRLDCPADWHTDTITIFLVVFLTRSHLCWIVFAHRLSSSIRVVLIDWDIYCCAL